MGSSARRGASRQEGLKSGPKSLYNPDMRICLACPAPPRSLKGNRVTAVRWARLLRQLGQRVTILRDWDGQPCDLLVALHARKSYPAIARYRKQRPSGPLIVALTGTDLYHDLRTSARARRSLELADRLVVLQPRGIDALPSQVRSRARAIVQSAEATEVRPAADSRFFDVAVLGHLRHEKDPFRAALALRLIPHDVPIRVTHLGQALSPAMERQARALMKRERRYRWLGEVSARRARRTLARSHLLVHSSRLEGGANVISEALADAVPIVASAIPGNIGLVGSDHPGLYPVGDTAALARLLLAAATDRTFYGKLKDRSQRLRPMVQPASERGGWKKLLAELT
jgi:putative glycosyltransferase (TIGR04348 family)